MLPQRAHRGLCRMRRPGLSANHAAPARRQFRFPVPLFTDHAIAPPILCTIQGAVGTAEKLIDAVALLPLSNAEAQGYIDVTPVQHQGSVAECAAQFLSQSKCMGEVTLDQKAKLLAAQTANDARAALEL